MIEIAIKEQFTWRKLINALLEEGLATATKEVEREVKSNIVYVSPYLKWSTYTPYTRRDFILQKDKDYSENKKSLTNDGRHITQNFVNL